MPVLPALIAEFQRRRVFRALVGYGVAAFAILQIIEPIMHGLHWPETVLSYTVVALAVGFPVVVTVAWIFDVHAGRAERPAPAKQARLILLIAGIGMLAAAPGTIWYLLLRPRASAQSTGERLGGRLDAASLTPAAASIAVLPFVNLSPDKDEEYFSDGVAEEILNALVQVEGLHVVGRTSSFSFKGKNVKAEEIARELNVASLLEGSVRREGKRVRVTAQLINAANGYHLWSQTYERELNSIFAVQDEIASGVVAALRVRLIPGRQPTTSGYRTDNPEVYRLYLLGRHWQSKTTREGNRNALAHLEQAVSLDPRYAPAHAALYNAHRAAANYAATEGDVAEHVRRASAEAEKAVELAPDLPYALSTRGFFRLTYLRDWSGARSDLTRALELSPAEPTAHRRLGILLSGLGRFQEGLSHLRRATDLDPLDVWSWNWLGRSAAASGDLQGARAAVLRALSIAPEDDEAKRILADIALLGGQPADALALAAKLDLEPDRLCVVALAEHALGHEPQSAAAASVMRTKYATVDLVDMAVVEAWRGDRDRAFQWLAVAARSSDDVFWGKVNPFLRSLEADPRWPAFLRTINLPIE